MMYCSILKRVFDIISGSCLFVILSPVIFITSAVILFTNRQSGIFFCQQRPGMNAKMFRLIKFKTMSDERDQEGRLLPDASRLTKVGKFLRTTSLDELPQLINGPRPLLPKYLTLYNSKHARRHEVRPGITGWSQVNGRNAIIWPKKLDLDVWYVDNISFWLDMKILCTTVIKVVKREGINASNSESGLPFQGY
jgi:undecaprenyl phosphate N,N'-diacetylbacillosamine 1-phosphate transferase